MGQSNCNTSLLWGHCATSLCSNIFLLHCFKCA
nr:MAG TPA: hypothetical protein [Caudoviricetes sp.]